MTKSPSKEPKILQHPANPAFERAFYFFLFFFSVVLVLILSLTLPDFLAEGGVHHGG